MTTLMQDLRYGLRMLARNPGFTAVAVITLALGIGANTAIFSVVNAVLLRPLPLTQPDRLVVIWETFRSGQGTASVPDLRDWQAQNSVFKDIAAYVGISFNLRGKERPEHVSGLAVSARFFSLMGVQPKIGRTFVPGEDEAGHDKVVVLSDGLWRGQFAADPDIIGRAISLNEEKFTVIGVTPRNFHFPYFDTELWVPFAPTPAYASQRDFHFLRVVARLKPGVTLAQAQAEMATIQERIAREYPETSAGRSAKVVPLQEELVQDVRLGLLVLLGAVAFVFLIACANVANLMLTRAVARQREIAIRSALGATRLRLARQLLTEGLVLALLGGTAGWPGAICGVRFLVALKPWSIPNIGEINPDARVLAFTLALSLIIAAASGVATLKQSSRTNLPENLKEAGRALSVGLRPRRGHSIWVVAEVATALILLTGAGLMLRSFWRLQHVDPGFQPERVLTMRVALPESKHPEEHPVSSLYEPVIESIEALPGVQSAGLITLLPLQAWGWNGDVEIWGHSFLQGQVPRAEFRAVSANYYRAMGIPLLSGRFLGPADNPNAPLVAIINEAMARRYLPAENPIGKRIRIAGRELGMKWTTIVGVVADSKQAGLSRSVRPEIDFPYTQAPHPVFVREMSIVVRVASDPASIANSVRKVVLSVDADQPVFQVKTMEQVITDSIADRRFDMILLETFAALAVVLAAVGIYGVISYTARQRTREIGIRMALGAGRRDVLRLVVGQGLRMTLVGVGIGVLGALALTRFLSSLLFGVKPTDPMTFIAVALILTAVALVASYIPARRATKVDPMVALRYE